MGSPSSRILITGGAGFIASHAARALAERGSLVLLLDVRKPDAEIQWLLRPVRDRVEFIRGDVTDLSFLIRLFQKEKSADVIHTATVNDLEILVDQPFVAQKIMVEGHMNLLEAARLAGTGRVGLHQLNRGLCTGSIRAYRRATPRTLAGRAAYARLLQQLQAGGGIDQPLLLGIPQGRRDRPPAFGRLRAGNALPDVCETNGGKFGEGAEDHFSHRRGHAARLYLCPGRCLGTYPGPGCIPRAVQPDLQHQFRRSPSGLWRVE